MTGPVWEVAAADRVARQSVKGFAQIKKKSCYFVNAN